jgi:dTDP-4-dehydrorhamnose reductase
MITIIGAGSRLAKALIPVLLDETDEQIRCVSSRELTIEHPRIAADVVDVTDKTALKESVMRAMPSTIINCAAITNVDACETDRQLAWAINVTLVENLARLARIVDAHLVHVSTDYVFDGAKGPYTETAVPSPINYYGKSKLAGENVCMSGTSQSTIVRTCLVYGPPSNRPDFVQWVIESCAGKTPIRVVNDQFAQPTYVEDIAEAILRITLRKRTGIYHVAGPDFMSRYDMALRIAEFFKVDGSAIQPITSAELQQPARRPHRSGLVSLKAETDLIMHMRDFTQGLSSVRHAMFSPERS